MEHFSLNVFQKDSGSIWQNRIRISKPGKRQNKIISCIKTYSPVLSVSNKCTCFDANMCKGSRFVHAAVDQKGKRLAAGDRHGHVYIFYLELNKFWLVSKLGSCCTTISFSPLKERDLLVASADCSLRIFESGQRKEIAHFGNHSSCISHISVDKDGHRFLTCSLKTTLVWDLLTLAVLHQLNFQLEENLVKSFFIPPGEMFLTALKEDRLLLWNTSTYEYSHQLKMHGDFSIRTLDVSNDGTLVAAGGRTSWLLIWALDGQDDQPTTLSVAAAKVNSVRQVAFFPSTRVDRGSHHILGVLSHEGVLHIYEVETGSQFLKLCLTNDHILCVETAFRNSFHFVALSFTGKMLLYNLDVLLAFSEKEQMQALEWEPMSDKADRRREFPKEPNNQKDLLGEATVSRLKGIVKDFGQYPDKYRYLIWKSLLGLPNNEYAFRQMLLKPTFPAFNNLHKIYPVRNTTVFRALERILSCLCHWCPRLSEVSEIPMLVFPFVKLFHQNMQVCFEVIVSFLCNWCRNWFTYYPSAPFNILTVAEKILSCHDPSLLLHFIRHGIPAQVYVWLILKTVFSEVVSKDMWLHLFDHILTNKPPFIIYLVVAFNVLLRQKLMRLSSLREYKLFYQEQQTVFVKELVSKAYSMQENSSKEVTENLKTAIGDFAPLKSTDRTYPTFDSFPNLEVDLKEENRQIQEEIDYIKNRQELLLNGNVSEERKLCNCTVLPERIRNTTCACVINPQGFSTKNEVLNPAVDSTPFLQRSPTAQASARIQTTNIPTSSKVNFEREPSTTTTDVIKKVLVTRRKLVQQRPCVP